MDSYKVVIVVFIFILVIAMVCMCDDIVYVAAIISIICSFVVINSNLFLISGLLYPKAPESLINDYKTPVESAKPLEPINIEHSFDNDIEYSFDKSRSAPISVLKDDKASLALSKGYQCDNPEQKHLQQRLYEMHESYNTPFTTLLPLNGLGIPEADKSVDTANIFQARNRARDKRVLTGAALKDANFFKKHYGKEFIESEDLRWWGRDES